MFVIIYIHVLKDNGFTLFFINKTSIAEERFYSFLTDSSKLGDYIDVNINVLLFPPAEHSPTVLAISNAPPAVFTVADDFTPTS